MTTEKKNKRQLQRIEADARDDASTFRVEERGRLETWETGALRYFDAWVRPHLDTRIVSEALAWSVYAATFREKAAEYGEVAAVPSAAAAVAQECQAVEVAKPARRVKQAKQIPVATPTQRYKRLQLGLTAVRTRSEFLIALEGLAGCVRNVQQQERLPRHGEAAPSNLTMVEDVLRALHAALGDNDTRTVKQIHERAVAALRDPGGSKRQGVAVVKSGASVRRKEHFGDSLIRLVKGLPQDGDVSVVARAILDAPIWLDGPFASLRGLRNKNLKLKPKIEAWVKKRWAMRAGRVDYTLLARSLLRDLGVTGKAASNTIPPGRH
jgi:hypothetical protein